MQSPLCDSTIWITGASTGIGKALALELAKRGSILILSARTLSTLTEVANQINQNGGKAIALPVDVLQLEKLKEVVAVAERQLSRPIDIHIACAGNHIKTVPEKFDSSEYLELMNTNYGGMLRSFEAVLPSMLRRKKGYLVGIASMVGYRGMPSAAAYGASKAAMINFLESIRFHLKNHNIKVTIVNPGFVKTPLTDKNEFKMPFLTTAERSAKIIADGLERGKKEISYPVPFNWFIKLLRVLPYALYEKIVGIMWQKMNRAK
ncbi:MAG TPA: SDR family NAD(P)-dependent oxidoreductase [Oligoflexia bacterium]|nr:SDR family NAD(P)-dependent oxidoreductase [Oligoflexia bacterium]HMP26436.1 SDR family NAD(P)-dependent oxidoreductase [Oligoflexia bacterium]